MYKIISTCMLDQTLNFLFCYKQSLLQRSSYLQFIPHEIVRMICEYIGCNVIYNLNYRRVLKKLFCNFDPNHECDFVLTHHKSPDSYYVESSIDHPVRIRELNNNCMIAYLSVLEWNNYSVDCERVIPIAINPYDGGMNIISYNKEIYDLLNFNLNSTNICFMDNLMIVCTQHHILAVNVLNSTFKKVKYPANSELVIRYALSVNTSTEKYVLVLCYKNKIDNYNDDSLNIQNKYMYDKHLFFKFSLEDGKIVNLTVNEWLYLCYNSRTYSTSEGQLVKVGLSNVMFASIEKEQLLDKFDTIQRCKEYWSGKLILKSEEKEYDVRNPFGRILLTKHYDIKVTSSKLLLIKHYTSSGNLIESNEYILGELDFIVARAILESDVYEYIYKLLDDNSRNVILSKFRDLILKEMGSEEDVICFCCRKIDLSYRVVKCLADYEFAGYPEGLMIKKGYLVYFRDDKVYLKYFD